VGHDVCAPASPRTAQPSPSWPYSPCSTDLDRQVCKSLPNNYQLFIHFSRILPDTALWQKLEMRLVDEVEQILIEYFSWLPKKARALYVHSEAMAKKSEVVS
jgi:hypothetical protein